MFSKTVFRRNVEIWVRFRYYSVVILKNRLISDCAREVSVKSKGR
jgi:hypothetical protein